MASKISDHISLNSIKSLFRVYGIASFGRTVGQLVLQSGHLVHFAGEKMRKWFAITTFPPFRKLILGLRVLKQQRGEFECLVGN